MQRIDGCADLLQPARRQPRIGRHEAHRVVTPDIGKPERGQVALVDPGRKRHQLHGVHTQPLQVIDDHRLGKCRHRAALLRPQVGAQHGEAAHRNFIDELRPLRRQHFGIRSGVTGNGLRHQRGRLHALAHQLRHMAERTRDARRIGIEQQLRRIEQQALLGRPRPFRPQPVLHARHEARHEAEMHVTQPLAQRDARRLHLVLEQRDEHARGMTRHDGDIGAIT